MKTVLKFVEKMDLVLHKHNGLLDEIRGEMKVNTADMESMKENMNNELHGTAVSATNDNITNKTSANDIMPFANIVRRSGILPSVVIKPKDDKQKCEATLKKLKEQIGEGSALVCDTKSIRGAGVVINCANAADTLKFKQLIDVNDDYVVRLPQIKKPRVRISRINNDMSKDEIMYDMMHKNNLAADASIEIKKVIGRRNGQTQEIIAEVDSKTFEFMMNVKKVLIGWNPCWVNEHVYLKRCFTCCGFSHIGKGCKHQVACSKCAGQRLQRKSSLMYKLS